jgi:hypothetical protein
VAEEVNADLPVKTRWAIVPEWFSLNNRSITAILQQYLCHECSKKFQTEGKESTPESLMAAIGSCCSHFPGFINEKLPVLEGVFRFFLTNGNTPVTIEELSEQINYTRGGSAYRYSPEALLRVLKADEYYGIQEIPG